MVMARRLAENVMSAQEVHIEMLKCYLRESEIILHSLEEQKITAGETLLFERRLSAARGEHLQLQNEISLATEKLNRLIRQKTVMQPA
ncbi:hypothetical protein F3J37_25705 [Pantoea sp. Al-1710]|uniref:Uncharacterized protein n=2 Tax=Gammaproteobacteria TaxID=1236 RepID=A0ABX0RY48_9GAMM|nr:hypothetical protein [Pantoea communis]NIG22063.1 hypothetical protein [Pantoea communis]